MIFREVFIIMPMLVSLFWGILLLAAPRQNISKRYLAFFMFLSTVNYFVHALYFSHEYSLFAFWDNIWIFTSLAAYPLYYNYIRLLTIDYKLSLKRFVVLLPAILLGLFSLVLYYKMSPSDMEIYLKEIMYHEVEKSSTHSIVIQMQKIKLTLFKIIFAIQVLYTFYFGSKLIVEHNRKVCGFYSNLKGRRLSAIIWVLYVFIFASVISLTSSIIGKDFFIDREWLLVIPSLTHTFFLFAVGYVGYNQNFTIADFEADIQHSNSIDSEETTLSDEVKQNLVKQLDYIMLEKELFRNSDFRISDLVKLLGTNRTYVSKIINEEKEMNFCEWINSYRVECAKEIMKESSNFELTMVEIAEKSGFSSRSVFYRAFKHKEGISPGEYRRQFNS